jgi:hypothetical protein
VFYGALSPLYPALGRPSIDPFLMFRMLILGYASGLRSERLRAGCKHGVTRAFFLVRRVIALEGQRSGQDRSGWDCGSGPGSPCK